MFANVGERLAISKQLTQKFDVERLNLRKINDMEVRKQYHTDISNNFAALENSHNCEDLNRAKEDTTENINTSAKDSLGLYELKQHKPRFNEECLRYLYQRQQAKMQWVQGPNQSNVDSLNTGRRDASRHFRNK